MTTIEEEKRLRRRNKRQIKKEHKLGFRAQNPARFHSGTRDKCNTELHQDFLNSDD